jgi:hypothetical protein
MRFAAGAEIARARPRDGIESLRTRLIVKEILRVLVMACPNYCPPLHFAGVRSIFVEKTIEQLILDADTRRSRNEGHQPRSLQP